MDEIGVMKIMRKHSIPSLITLAFVFALAPGAKKAEARQNTQEPSPKATAGSTLEGVWEGALDVGATKVRLALKVTKAADGALAAKLDSVDKGATDLPVDVISLKDGAVHFEMKRLTVAFNGTLNKESSEIAGQFNQDGVKLAGTLTLPRGKTTFPAVILITGSGAQNRNEEVLGHKPFLVLADYLTRQGVAVLRVDDRGVGGSTGSVSNSTSENFGTDVLAGIEFLKGRKEVNPKQIGLIGHSEGGLIAPMVAAQSNDVAFIVLLAGPGLPGEEILYLQSALILKASGASAEAMARQRATQEMIFTILKQEKDNAVVEKKLREEFDKRVAGASEADKIKAKQAAEAQIKQALSPWFRYFLTCDPRPALAKVKCPVLALNGENDMQVPVTENLREIESTLKSAGNKDVTIVRMPRLNHLFQTSETGSPSEYGKIEETIAPVALKTIGDWILKHATGQ